MNRRLMLLNGTLAAVLAFAGVQWRRAYVAVKDREHKMLTGGPKTAPKAQWTPLPNQSPVLATGYNDVAQKLLLHPTRNPDIPPPVVEKPPAPPPPPMPTLPKYHGTMNLDGHQVALLSIGNAGLKEVGAGEEIGPFKLIDITIQDITYEWMGKQVRKTLLESIDRTETPAAQTNNAPVAAAAPEPAPPAIKTAVGPKGDVTGFGTKACDPNDSYPTGAVVDGFRKASIPTPFGAACRWEPVGK